MDQKYVDKLQKTRGCTSCAINLADNLVTICDKTGKGEKCKDQMIGAVKGLIENKVTKKQFEQKVRKAMGKPPTPPKKSKK